MSSLQIAIVTNRFAPYIGGIERQMELVGLQLALRGHEVTVLTRRYDPSLPQREPLANLTVERFGPSGQGVIAKWLVNAGTFYRLLTRRPRFDCVLVTQFSATVMGPALAHALGGPPVVLRPIETGEFSGEISRGSLSQLPLGVGRLLDRALQVVRQMAYQQAKVIVAPSELLVREAREFGFPPESITRVPNPVDTTVFRPVPPEQRREIRLSFDLPLDAEVLTFTGRLVKGKGLLTLATAWKEVAPLHPRALLVIVGVGPGPDSPLDAEQALRQFIQHARLEDRVLFTGFRRDVQRYLQTSDIFVFPSSAEGFGNSLSEAMACGLPVICSYAEGAAADLVREGVHGLKFEEENPASLAGRIHELLMDKDSRARMGTEGRLVAEQWLSVDVAVAAYEAALRRAIEQG